MRQFHFIFHGLALMLGLCLSMSVPAANLPISLFPIEHYDQRIDHVLPPSAADYDKRLLSARYQKQRLEDFYQHLFATDAYAESPWSEHFVNKLLNQPPSLTHMIERVIQQFNNVDNSQAVIGYGENFRPYSHSWIKSIRRNLNLRQFNAPVYAPSQRAIAVRNLNVRALPTQDPFFFHFSIAGQGFPFDNLQTSALWAGTPLYVVGVSLDKAWSYVITPAFMGWVKSDGIAMVTTTFIQQWQTAAKTQLGAVIKTRSSLHDTQGRYQMSTYVGAVFPIISSNDQNHAIYYPIRDDNGLAKIRIGQMKSTAIAPMPLPATKHNFARIMSTLINRPYGWGGAYFYNDCSQELRSLFAAFGIWLPRHSSDQISAGKSIDLSSKNLQARLAYLKKSGVPLMSLVYIGGHVFLYLGTQPNPTNPSDRIIMTYQNIWGLKPAAAQRRAVIGKSVILPLMKRYPEDARLKSLAEREYFQVTQLSQWPQGYAAQLAAQMKHTPLLQFNW